MRWFPKLETNPIAFLLTLFHHHPLDLDKFSHFAMSKANNNFLLQH